MLELPTAHYFLSDKVGAAHYVIQQSELSMVRCYKEIER